MARPALLALLVLLILPGVAAAAPSLRLKDAGRGRLLISDGERYLVVSRTTVPDRAKPGQLTVRDLRRGTLRTIAELPGCAPEQARRGVLVWDCPVRDQVHGSTSGVVEDLRTGERTPLPKLAPAGGLDSVQYVSAGSRWLLVHETGYHYRGQRLVDRTTGLRQPPSLEQRERDRVVDLGAESGERGLCRGHRAPLVPTYSGPTGDEVAAGPLDRDGVRAVATTLVSDDAFGPREMVYQRCGRPERVIHRCPPPPGGRCGHVQIDGRWVAWAWEAPGRKPYLSEVVLYDTRSRRRRFIPRADSVELLGGRVAVLRHGRVFLGRLP